MKWFQLELDYTCDDGEELVHVIEDMCRYGAKILGIVRPRGQWPRLKVEAEHDALERLLMEYTGGDTVQAEFLLGEATGTCPGCKSKTKVKEAYLVGLPSGEVLIDACAACA